MGDESENYSYAAVFSLGIAALTVFSILAKIMENYLVSLFYTVFYGYDFEFSVIVRKRFSRPSWFIKCNRNAFGGSCMPSIQGDKPFLVRDHHGRFIIFAKSMTCLRHAEEILDATEFINTEPPIKSKMWKRVLRFIDRWKAGIFVTGKLDWRINNRIPIARILYRLREENSIDIAIWKDKTIESVTFRPYSASLFENQLTGAGFVSINKEIKDTYFELYYGLLLRWRAKNEWTVCGLLIDMLFANVKPKFCDLDNYVNKFNLVFQLRGHLVRSPKHYAESTLEIVDDYIYNKHPRKFGFLKCFLPVTPELRHLKLNRLLKIAMCCMSKKEFSRMLVNGEMKSTDFHKFCIKYCEYSEHLKISIFRRYDSRDSLTFQTYYGKEKDILETLSLELRLIDKTGKEKKTGVEKLPLTLSPSIASETRVYSVRLVKNKSFEQTMLDRFLNDDSAYVI